MEATSYRVVGVRESGEAAELILQSENEENARAEAKLCGISVESIEVVLRPLEAQSELAEAKPRKARIWVVVAATMMWICIPVAMLAAGAVWMRPSYERPPPIEAMMGGSPRAIVLGAVYVAAYNMFGFVALGLGILLYAARRRVQGPIAAVLACTVIAWCASGQVRESRKKLTTTPMAATTATQQQRANQELARVLGTAGSREGIQMPSVADDEAMFGEMCYFVRAHRECINGIRSARWKYADSLKDFNSRGLLDASNLDTREKLLASKASIEAGSRAFDEYESAIHERIASWQKSMDAAPYTPQVRSNLIHGLASGLRRSNSEMELSLRCEREMYEELRALFDHALAENNGFRVVEGKLRFDRNEDALTYNASIRRYKALAARQAQLRSNIAHRASSMTGNLAKGGGGSVRSTATTQKAAVHIECGASGFTINGTLVHLPIALGELEKLLGPSGSEETLFDYDWESLGIHADTEVESEKIDCITLILNASEDGPPGAKTAFGGSLSIAGLEVHDIDTPRSLNRHLPAAAFEAMNSKGTMWQLNFPGYVIRMDIGSSGFSDEVMICRDD